MTDVVIDTPKKARLIVLLDRSQSMSKIKGEAIAGFNIFIDEQRKIPGEATFTQINFDHKYELVQNAVSIQEAQHVTDQTFRPRGMTALYDAILQAITDYKDSTQPDVKTILAVLTDGEDTSSENKVEAVREAITYVEKEFGWEVLFLGANIDVRAYASSMGIKAMNAANFVATGKGVIDAMTTVSASASAYRGSSFSVGGVMMNAANLDTSALYAAVAKGEKVEYDKAD